MALARLLTSFKQGNFEHDLPKAGDVFAISGENHRHVAHALRFTISEPFEVYDPVLRLLAICKIEGISLSQSQIKIHSVKEIQGSANKITLILGAPKPKTLDLITEKAVELEINSLVIFKAHGSQNIGRNFTSRKQRLEKIAMAALKQSHATSMPTFEFHDSLASALKQINQLQKLNKIKIICEEPTEDVKQPIKITDFLAKQVKNKQLQTKKLEIKPNSADLYLVIGPEGGLTREERKLAKDDGFQPVSLRNNILRVETAVISAISSIRLILD